jgi:uncharacterized protein (DUF1697 family)
MHTFVSLLRGINIGGHHLVRMPALKSLYESMGFADVATYIQSGNVVFRTNREDASSIEILIESQLAKTFGFPVAVVVRTPSELGKVIKASPYARRKGIDINRLAVAFLKSRPPAAHIRNLATAAANTTDEHLVAGSVVYLHCPNGFGKTLLTTTFLEKYLEVGATARNWKTLAALQAMCLPAE